MVRSCWAQFRCFRYATGSYYPISFFHACTHSIQGGASWLTLVSPLVSVAFAHFYFLDLSIAPARSPRQNGGHMGSHRHDPQIHTMSHHMTPARDQAPSSTSPSQSHDRARGRRHRRRYRSRVRLPVPPRLLVRLLRCRHGHCLHFFRESCVVAGLELLCAFLFLGVR